MQQAILPNPGHDWTKVAGVIISAVGVAFGIFRWYINRKDGKD